MPHTVVIFGASGDLTSRKLVPALYQLHCKDRLPDETRIVGTARSDISLDGWRDQLRNTTAEYSGASFDAESWNQFARSVFYQRGDVGRADDFGRLSEFLDEIERGADSARVYYLSTAPQLYATAVEHLGAAGLTDESRGERRIVVEKPFGTDLESARSLNEILHRVFAERQVFRIDHYLGKETVQNIMILVTLYWNRWKREEWLTTTNRL